MRLLSFSAVAIFAAGALAVPTPDSHVVHEQQGPVIARRWRKLARRDQDMIMPVPVRIGLRQSNLHMANELLMDVSHHASPNYGKHYTSDEVVELFKPSDSAVESVKVWLTDAGIASDRISQSANKQWIQFDGTLKELEGLLHTEYHVFENERTGLQDVACEKYHVPAKVQEHVDYITPGIKLHGGRWGGKKELRKKNKRSIRPPHTEPRPLPMSEASLSDSIDADPLAKCDTTITPACLVAMYNITTGTRTIHPNNSIGIFEDLGDRYDQADLNSFYAKYSKNIPKGTGPVLNLIDGATAPATSIFSAGAESLLDLSLAFPLVYPQKIGLFQTDDDPTEASYTFGGFFNNFLDAIDGSYCNFTAYGITGNSDIDPPYPNPVAGGYKGALQCGVFEAPKVISISYGGDEQGFPMAYAERQCLEFMKLGLQGTTVVISSGDSGVGENDGCIVSDPFGFNATTSTGSDGKIFNPDWASACPYVTAVGSTVLPQGASVHAAAEIATTRFPSGGGFSNFFATPDWQSEAVNSYLEANISAFPSYVANNGSGVGANGGIFNSGGRGYPDVAASGDNIVIYYQGQSQLIGGTSASAPIFASLLTLINEQRLNAGKATVGFVNPILYANPQVFHDITNGSNPNCGTTGFLAGEGWDPVTGLGTPNFPALLELLMAQP